MANELPTPCPLELEIAGLLNRYNQDNEADTPDYVLAQFLFTCLSAYKTAMRQKELHDNLHIKTL